jgi:hypothetical protein
VLGPAGADAVGLIQKEIAVTQGGFRVLVNCHDDRLDVLVAPPFAGCSMPDPLEGGAEALLTKPIDFVALRAEIDGRVARAA